MTGAGVLLDSQQSRRISSSEGGRSSDPSAAKLFHRRVAAMRHVALRDMRRGTYVPVVDEGSARCRESLEWWTHDEE